MATPTGKKRPLPPKVAAMKARKRRKINGDAPQESKTKPLRTPGLTSESLAWKAVSMPDHLDDYEGFFGLEEVEDVEVVRDAESGNVSFSSKSKAAPVDVAPGLSDDEEAGGDEEWAGEEWTGFDDKDPKSALGSHDPDGKDPRQPQKVKPKVKTTKQGSQNGSKTDHEQPGTFQSLSSDSSAKEVDVSAWKPLQLSPDTLASLAKLKFSQPTPIQRSSIPEILAGHDVIGKASTGSGKTLAFGIPILEHHLELESTKTSGKVAADEKTPVAMILSPTRELAHQLDKHLTALFSSGSFHGPSIATLTGGLSVQKQQRLLKHADIVIGTPGRLWEVLSEGRGLIQSMKKIKFLVIDEADRLLSEGHFKEVEEILNALDRQDTNDDEQSGQKKSNDSPEPVQRQTLILSATFDRSLQKKLAGKGKPSNDLMDNKQSLEYLLSKINFREDKPKFIDANPIKQMATGLKEGLVECAGSEKDLYLYTLLLLHPSTRTLIFTNSISAVRRLTPFLQHLKLPALALNSSMAQRARMRSVEAFSKTSDSTCSILVATDIAARGLDIPNVQLVIHYHLPRAADTYVHRSGRTARAGQPGSSILICGPEEVAGVRRLVAKVHAHAAVRGEDKDGKKLRYFIRTLDLDRRIISRLKPRATLAKQIADATIAKEKGRKEDDFMRAAAEELGVDYDSDTFDAEGARGKRGRGAGRKKKEKEARGLSKAEVGALKAELKRLLAERVNAGVSERYLTSGGLDIDTLLLQQYEQRQTGREFLGDVQTTGMDDL